MLRLATGLVTRLTRLAARLRMMVPTTGPTIPMTPLMMQPSTPTTQPRPCALR